MKAGGGSEFGGKFDSESVVVSGGSGSDTAEKYGGNSKDTARTRKK